MDMFRAITCRLFYRPIPVRIHSAKYIIFGVFSLSQSRRVRLQAIRSHIPFNHAHIGYYIHGAKVIKKTPHGSPYGWTEP